MLALLLLASLPLTLAGPLIDLSPAPTAAALSKRGISAPLTHGKGYVRRAKAVAKAKRNSSTRPRGHRERRHSGSWDDRRRVEERADDDESLPSTWLLWAAARVDSKYNSGTGGFAAAYAVALSKRANGEVQLADHNLDTSYSASLSLGTPAQSLDIVLDTGSSDLWVASDACTAGACSDMTTFDASASTSLVNLTSAFSIEYGSGNASGSLVQDLVTLGGYSVASQTFASCNTVSSGLLSSGVSGIMGLSWQSLAYSGAVPWWLTLAESSSWSDPLFAFYLARYRDVSGASTVESSGGMATFGYLDSSLYSGSVTYVSVASDAEYWQIAMDSVTIQGSSISLGSSSTVAIDTGTTLIGGPETIIAAIYAEIPNSQRMTGSYASYYEYPCSTSIDFELTFGGYTIKITDQDFNLGKYSSDTTMCTGAAYVQALSSSSPVQWIVGDAALKNTYTVFRYNPSAVGFAALASDVTSSAATASTTIPDGSAALAGGSTSTASSSSASGSASGSGSGSASANATSSSSGGGTSGGSSASSSGGSSAGSGSSTSVSQTGISASAHVVDTTVTASAASAGGSSASAAAAESTSTSGAASGIAVTGMGLLGVIGCVFTIMMI